MDRSKITPALKILLEVYNQRPDLQEVYAEAWSGDYRRLIDWAAGVSTGKWKDASREALAGYSEWYSQNYTGTPPLTPTNSTSFWNSLMAASEKSSNPMPITLGLMHNESARDISHHLVTLSMLIVENNLKEIVELGTRDGNSTLVMLEAASKIGGRVLSIDADPCLEAKRRVEQAGLTPFWRFFQSDDLDFDFSNVPANIDLLFIDTNHLYAQTINELRRYGGRVSRGCWIVLHDYASYPGVRVAVGEFIESLPQTPRLYQFVHQNGLALIKL